MGETGFARLKEQRMPSTNSKPELLPNVSRDADMNWPPEFPFSFEKEPFDYLRHATCRRIVIDGDPGAGKTTLAQIMARQLNASVISFDDYMPGDGGVYTEQIDCARLKFEILAAQDKTVIIEGVCMLQIMSKIDLEHDYHIFLKL